MLSKNLRKMTTGVAGAAVLVLVAMVGATSLLLQNAGAVTTTSDDCRNAIKAALTDRRITFTEMQTIKAECTNGVVPSGCLATVRVAREDHVITQAEITAIKAACRIA